jgi:hypothetical protein
MIKAIYPPADMVMILRISEVISDKVSDKNSFFDRGTIGEMGLCVKKISHNIWGSCHRGLTNYKRQPDEYGQTCACDGAPSYKSRSLPHTAPIPNDPCPKFLTFVKWSETNE